VQGVIPLNKITRPENADREGGCLDRLDRGQDVPSVQRQEELASSLHCGGQHVKVLGMHEGGVFLQVFLVGNREEIPFYSGQVVAKAVQRL